jgi:NAD(P)-dependent dehydrogenase (short-subunit alcohol dehydrogenase family)
VYGGVSSVAERDALSRGGLVRPLVFDVTNDASRQSVVDRVLALEGQLDVLVLVAGRPKAAVEPEAVFARNVWGPLALARRCVKLMKEQGSGAIVFAGGGARHKHGPLAAADLALSAMIEVTRDQLRPFQIRVAQVDLASWRGAPVTADQEVVNVIARVVSGPTADDGGDTTDTVQRAATVPAAPRRDAPPPRLPPVKAKPTPAPAENLADVISDDEWSDVAIPMEDDSAFDEATDVAAPKAWLEIEGGATHALLRPVTRVGRGRANDIRVLTDGQLSRSHFAIVRRAGHYYAQDDNTVNGTRVEGAEITSRRLLGGEWISAGDTRFRFRLEG